MELTGLLLLLFAIAIGFATFVENDFGTIAAKSKVYNAKWFEFLLLILAVNMTGSIFKHKMYVRSKWTMLLFHVSFLIIFVGAAITRYISYEGTLSIREGETSNRMVSDETYIQVWANDGNVAYHKEKKVFATPFSAGKFSDGFSYGSKNVSIEILDYFKNAGETLIEGDGGPILWLVMSSERLGRQNVYFENGEQRKFGGYDVTFNTDPDSPESFRDRDVENGINIHHDGTSLYFSSPDSVSFMSMATQTTVMLAPDTIHPLQQMALYRTGSLSIVVKQYYDNAHIGLISTEGQEGMNIRDAFTAKITVNDQSAEVNVFGGKGYTSKPVETTIDGIDFSISYGAKVIELPFSLKLDDFELERYPGSNSPSSYASDVTVIDESKDLVMPYRIYMNNVLNYGGYRFFQSSYDRDELGTILSVNHDAMGTIITYLGYLLMTIGMFATIFNKNSRFRLLARLSAKLRQSRKTAMWLILLATTFFFTMQSQRVQAAGGEQGNLPVVDADHAARFGKLLVQDKDGRIKPINTLSSQVLRKIARKNSYDGMNPDQVFLGILAFTDVWQSEALIKVANPELKDYLKIDGKYASFNDIVDVHTSGGYKIKEFVERAYAKKASLQNKFDKEVMKVDERINIFYMVYSGMFLTVFPIPDHPNSKWATSDGADKNFNGEEALFVKGILSMYYDAVKNAVETGDWTEADEHLEYILHFQTKHGKQVIQQESKINLEISYNRYNIFKRLASYYGLIGFILLVLHFINILKPKINLKWVIRISSILVILLFLVHTAGLILRWNISGHAPWSDGYESMIYIGWATILSGLIFFRRSEITLAVTAVLASLILAVAGMSWMDPEITNLVPVLKSYWLIIHVAIITASYGFLALGSLLGFFNLILMNLKTKNNFERLNLTITELTYIIEMTLIIGLFMLTIGTFLGGVWANESWGRYWGWDPKETWALVTVLVYSFVAHMRFIPGFRGNFAYSFASLISYGSVLMTYFGVNYYLSGLHSYAKGDPVPVPNFVYYTLIVIVVVGIMAYISDRKYSNKQAKVE